jgi:hypothetical protein
MSTEEDKPTPPAADSSPASCSAVKLTRLYHFGDLHGVQGWGGVWQTIGVTFSPDKASSNVWNLRRVMTCGDGETIGDERETLEVILTTYCQRVQFHPLETEANA